MAPRHREEFLPLQNGFDEYAGLICSNDMWPVGYDGKPIQSTKKLLSHDVFLGG